jgi:hypothetical protein
LRQRALRLLDTTMEAPDISEFDGFDPDELDDFDDEFDT